MMSRWFPVFASAPPYGTRTLRLSILGTCAAVANLFAVVVQLGNLQPGQLAYGMITFRRIVNMHSVLSFLLQSVGAGAYRECLP